MLELLEPRSHRRDRRAAVLGAEELTDARVVAAVRGALAELRSLHGADPGLVPGAAAVLEGS